MLKNIKMVLGITDDSQDELIDYYIETSIRALLNLIKMDDLPVELESCIERKVIQLMQGGFEILRTTEIKRGDYKIKYEYDSSYNKNMFSDMLGELKPYLKRVRFF